MQFIKNNFVYVLWFLVYFIVACALFGFHPAGCLLVLVFYAISITIALSGLGEVILRLIEGVRPLCTREEIELLQQIFDEVYSQALDQNPKLNQNIKVYMTDSMCPNAFALGRKTIAVTKGALETFTPDELKGILAHEFGHISHGHTKALLLSVVGNLFFTFLIFISKAFLFIAELISALFTNGGAYIFSLIFVWLTRLCFDLSIIIFMGLGQIILAINSRSNEYQADSFACTIGYGEELTSALYLLQKISMGQKLTLFERMTLSHPHIAKRIKRLETVEIVQTA